MEYRMLTDAQKKVICDRLGIFCKPKTLREIADILQVIPERIRQIEAKAIRIMQNNLRKSRNKRKTKYGF